MTTESRPTMLAYARREPLPEEPSLLRRLGIYAIVYGVVTTFLSLEWFYGALVGYGTSRWGVQNPYTDHSSHGASLLVAVAVLLGGMRSARRGDTRLLSVGLIACTTLTVVRLLLQLPWLLQSNVPPARLAAVTANLLLGTAGAIVVLLMIMRLVQFSRALQEAEPHARTETWRRIQRATAWLVIVPPLASLMGTAVMVVQYVFWPTPQVSIGLSTWLGPGFSAAFALAGAAFYFRLPRAWLACMVFAVISVPAPLIWWCAEFGSWQQWKLVLMSVFTSVGAHTVLGTVPLATLLVMLLMHPRMRPQNG